MLLLSQRNATQRGSRDRTECTRTEVTLLEDFLRIKNICGEIFFSRTSICKTRRSEGGVNEKRSDFGSFFENKKYLIGEIFFSRL